MKKLEKTTRNDISNNRHIEVILLKKKKIDICMI